jgi:tetratricopeptide (TPR) repeat protein
MNTQESAKYLTQKGKTCSPEQVSRWAKDGLFQGAKKDAQGRWDISVEALNTFLESKLTKRPFYQFKRFWGAIIAVLAFVIVASVNLVTFLDGFRGAKMQLLDLTCGSIQRECPFSPERNGETLIVIAHFRSGVPYQSDIHDNIKEAILSASLEEPRIQNLRVEVDSEALDSENQDEAVKLANRYNASIIIWGEEIGTQITVKLYNRKQPSLPLINPIIAENQRLQLAYVSQPIPNPYTAFVTEELPNHMAFFALFSLALSFTNQEEYKNSITLMEKAVGTLNISSSSTLHTLPKGVEQAFLFLGVHYSITGNFDQAIKNYNQLLKFKLDYAEATFLRGNAYAMKGDFDLAIKDYNQAIKLRPDYVSAIFLRGVAYDNKGDLHQAIVDYSQAVRLEPDNVPVLGLRGSAYTRTGELEKAMEDCNQAVKLEPSYIEGFICRGLIYAQKGDFDKTLEESEQALKLNSNYSRALVLRGSAYSEKEKYDEAIADCSRALQIEPGLAEALITRGLAYYRKGDIDRAITDYTQALELKPDLAQALLLRGLALAGKNDANKASSDYKKALEISTDPVFRVDVQKQIDALNE